MKRDIDASHEPNRDSSLGYVRHKKTFNDRSMIDHISIISYRFQLSIKDEILTVRCYSHLKNLGRGRILRRL